MCKISPRGFLAANDAKVPGGRMAAPRHSAAVMGNALWAALIAKATARRFRAVIRPANGHDSGPTRVIGGRVRAEGSTEGSGSGPSHTLDTGEQIGRGVDIGRLESFVEDAQIDDDVAVRHGHERTRYSREGLQRLRGGERAAPGRIQVSGQDGYTGTRDDPGDGVVADDTRPSVLDLKLGLDGGARIGVVQPDLSQAVARVDETLVDRERCKAVVRLPQLPL